MLVRQQLSPRPPASGMWLRHHNLLCLINTHAHIQVPTDGTDYLHTLVPPASLHRTAWATRRPNLCVSHIRSPVRPFYLRQISVSAACDPRVLVARTEEDGPLTSCLPHPSLPARGEPVVDIYRCYLHACQSSGGVFGTHDRSASSRRQPGVHGWEDLHEAAEDK